jgi:hypothetical protein
MKIRGSKEPGLGLTADNQIPDNLSLPAGRSDFRERTTIGLNPALTTSCLTPA